MVLDVATASRFAARALSNLAQEYPHKLDHTMAGDADAAVPRALHPAFHASYDWHSCVHMHWLLARLLHRFPGLHERAAIEACFDRNFAARAIAAELAYLRRPGSASFERTYGWAWLLKLAAELYGATGRTWREALQPLADAFVARYLDFLPRAGYPIRYGMHANSAFALAFALDYARVAGNEELAKACRDKALGWFAGDRDAPAHLEPSGVDFLSPSLVEAALMQRVLHATAFARRLDAFLPGFAAAVPASLFAPVNVTDRDDAQLVHLDGLNLSRAWCFKRIASALPAGDRRIRRASAAARMHETAGAAGLASDAFVGAHWLATFAVPALDD